MMSPVPSSSCSSSATRLGVGANVCLPNGDLMPHRGFLALRLSVKRLSAGAVFRKRAVEDVCDKQRSCFGGALSAPLMLELRVGVVVHIGRTVSFPEHEDHPFVCSGVEEAGEVVDLLRGALVSQGPSAADPHQGLPVVMCFQKICCCSGLHYTAGSDGKGAQTSIQLSCALVSTETWLVALPAGECVSGVTTLSGSAGHC